MSRISAILLVAAALVLFGACDQQNPESTDAAGGQVKAPEPTATTSADLTYTATLTFTKVLETGQTSDEVELLCSNLPLSEDVFDKRNCLELDLEFASSRGMFTGSIQNESIQDMMPTFEMKNVELKIEVSDGQVFSWRPHDGGLSCGAGEGVNIPAGSLKGK